MTTKNWLHPHNWRWYRVLRGGLWVVPELNQPFDPLPPANAYVVLRYELDDPVPRPNLDDLIVEVWPPLWRWPMILVTQLLSK